jgi:quercetin dioxygenase-like cupin family protein
MPLLVRPDQNTGSPLTQLLGPGDATDGRVTAEVRNLNVGEAWSIESSAGSLLWIQLIGGSAKLEDSLITRDHIVMASGGARLDLVCESPAQLFYAHVPNARDYDENLVQSVVVHDWSREPVLNSEHDSRQRIYLASPKLWGTRAVKGEMIIYPPGASGAAHHHEGAEHFQYLISGGGTAILEAQELDLQPGDLLYNFENEVHSFANNTDDSMVFVEFFVPGESSTVWIPGANACGWQPTGVDIQGRVPAREVGYHIHGQGDV